MSSPKNPDTDITIKATAAHWLKHQPFLHILLLAILASILYLAYIDKPAIIPDVIRVGGYSVAVALIGVACSWFAPRIQVVVESIPHMTAAFDSLATAYGVLSRFVAATQAENVRNNKVVLLVEDSTVQARLIRAMCVDLVAEFHLSFRDVGSLNEAFTYIQSACVAILDVILPDNDDPAAINILITLAGCPVIIHTGSEHSMSDFPGAFAVIHKTDSNSFDLLKSAMRRAIASTRFPA